jgi:drug/metabolite transporter (DMT)-like permease
MGEKLRAAAYSRDKKPSPPVTLTRSVVTALMLLSFFAAFFFALSATCAHRSLKIFGSAKANLGRLFVATALLLVISFSFGHGFTNASTSWFLLSGLIGIGLGDLGLYAALPHLGSPLTVLIMQCLAAPIAALGEWLWLGTTLRHSEIFWGALILIGVAIALLPARGTLPRKKVQPIGFIFGIVAASGQGLGAVVSRKGVSVAHAAGETVRSALFGLDAACHRTLAALIFTIAWFFVLRRLGRLPSPSAEISTDARRRGRAWMIANGLAGPVFGVGLYQWALATNPSGLVMPIVATTPLLSIPVTYFLEHERPSARSIVGSMVAVVGCVALAISR